MCCLHGQGRINQHRRRHSASCFRPRFARDLGNLQQVDQFNWMLEMQTAPLDFTANTQMALIYDREFEGPWVPQKV